MKKTKNIKLLLLMGHAKKLPQSGNQSHNRRDPGKYSVGSSCGVI